MKTLPESFPFLAKTPILDNLNRLLVALEARLQVIETVGTRVDGAIEDLTAVALARMNDVFTPLILDAQVRLSSVGAAFSATSSTNLAISTGEKYLTIDEEMREAYAFSEYVSIAHVGGMEYMQARVLGYDRPNGQLYVEVTSAYGSGTFNAWDIKLSVAPNVSHETNYANPHNTTAVQVGAYDTIEVDNLLTNLSIEKLSKAANLSDLTNVSAARTAIGLGSAVITWSKPQAVSSAALSSGSAADFSSSPLWTVNVSGSTFTISNPSAAPSNYTSIMIIITFTTNNSLSFGDKFTTTGYVQSTSGKDVLTFLYDSNVDKYYLIGFRNGVSV